MVIHVHPLMPESHGLVWNIDGNRGRAVTVSDQLADAFGISKAGACALSIDDYQPALVAHAAGCENEC